MQKTLSLLLFAVLISSCGDKQGYATAEETTQGNPPPATNAVTDPTGTQTPSTTLIIKITGSSSDLPTFNDALSSADAVLFQANTMSDPISLGWDDGASGFTAIISSAAAWVKVTTEDELGAHPVTFGVYAIMGGEEIELHCLQWFDDGESVLAFTVTDGVLTQCDDNRTEEL